MSAVIHQDTPRAGAMPQISALAGTLAAGAAIWTAVVVTSVFAPDMIHGSEHEHLKVAAITWWFWGAIATGFAFVPGAVDRAPAGTRSQVWTVFAAIVGAAWLVATVLAIATPRHVTGSDPTEVPIGAMIAPVGAMIVTAFAAAFTSMVVRRR